MRLAAVPSFWVVVIMAVSVICVRTAPTSQRTSIKKHLIRHERNNPERERPRREHAINRLKGPAECCPTTETIIAPELGRSLTGMALELFRNENTTQIFHERVCDRGFANKQCRYIDRKYRKYSKCVQQWSQVYALVRDIGTKENYRVDYIKIRNGCSCQIIPRPKSSQQQNQTSQQMASLAPS